MLIDSILNLLVHLVGYPLVLVGSILFLGVIYRWSLSNKKIPWLNEPKHALLALGVMTLMLVMLLSHGWSSEPQSVTDLISNGAFLANAGIGVNEASKHWDQLLAWAKSKLFVSSAG